jgi:kinetochore protein Spc24
MGDRDLPQGHNTARSFTNNHSRLKLKLYRTLGIDVEADPTTGEYNKAVIRNAAKGDVHVVNIDPKFSRHFYTNYFWRTM